MASSRYFTCSLLLLLIPAYLNAVDLDRRFLQYKCYKQKLDWFNKDKCHKPKLNQNENRIFASICNGKKYLKDEQNNLRPRAGEESVQKVKRQEYRCMNRTERFYFHRAIDTMKKTRVGEETLWNNFVLRHDSEQAPGAHYGPNFLGWHRHFLFSLEQAMKTIHNEAHLPYWDNRLEKRLDTYHRGSALFSKYLLGTNDGEVRDGIASNWQVVGQSCIGISQTLKRSVQASNAYLFSDGDVETVMENNLKDISAPWASYFEDVHGSIHMYFGADSAMGPVNCSPNDPVFFLHHCFIDKLFEKFRKRLKERGLPLVYPDTSAQNLPTWFTDTFDVEHTHAANATMLPFEGLTNADGFTRDDYTDVYYDYESSPGDVTECESDNDCCGGRVSYFLWCNTNTGRCVAKVKEGADMDRNHPDNACLCPLNLDAKNINGVCTCEPKAK